MEHFQWLVNLILAVCAFIAAVGGASKYIKNVTDKMKQPYEDLKSRVTSLEEKNESNRRDIVKLEELLKIHIDESNKSQNVIRQEIKDQIETLRTQIETNEKNTKLILKEILAVSEYITNWSDDSLMKLKDANNDIVTHLVGEE